MGASIVTTTGNEVSLQVAQDLYNDFTGRTERIHRFWSEPHSLTMSDLEALHALVKRTFEQYTNVTSNLTIVVRHSDHKSERFSGFSRFKAQGVRNHPVEEVEFEYNVLLTLPQTKEPKPYKLVVGMRNTLCVLERIKTEDISRAAEMVALDSCRYTGRLEIEYVDLAVARNIEAQIEEWFDALAKRKFPKFLKLLSSIGKESQPIVVAAAVLAAGSLLLLKVAPSVQTVNTAFKSGIVSLTTMLLVVTFSRYLGFFVQRQFHKVRSYSHIALTQKDFEMAKALKDSSGAIFLRVFVSLLGSVAIGLFTSYLGTLVGL